MIHYLPHNQLAFVFIIFIFDAYGINVHVKSSGFCFSRPGGKAEVIFSLNEQLAAKTEAEEVSVPRDHKFVLTGLSNQKLFVMSREPVVGKSEKQRKKKTVRDYNSKTLVSVNVTKKVPCISLYMLDMV